MVGDDDKFESVRQFEIGDPGTGGLGDGWQRQRGGEGHGAGQKDVGFECHELDLAALR